MEASNRREELFYTRALVKDKSAVVVIDERGSTNFASTYMVEKMALPTIPHVKPYRIQGPSESEGFEVTRQAYVSFSIGRFEEIEVCDVVPMQSCHLLLGKPWKTFRKGAYDESRNRYILRCQGRWISLVPSTPKQAMEDRLHVQQTHERWEAMKEEAARKERELKAEKERLEKEEVIEPTWIEEFEYTWLGESERVTKEDVSEPNVEQKQGNPIEDGVQDDGRVEEPLELTVVDHEAKRKEFLEFLSRRYIQEEEFLEFLPSLKGLTIDVQDLRTNPFEERGDDMILEGVTTNDLVLIVYNQKSWFKVDSWLANQAPINCFLALEKPSNCQEAEMVKCEGYMRRPACLLGRLSTMVNSIRRRKRKGRCFGYTRVKMKLDIVQEKENSCWKNMSSSTCIRIRIWKIAWYPNRRVLAFNPCFQDLGDSSSNQRASNAQHNILEEGKRGACNQLEIRCDLGVQFKLFFLVLQGFG